MIDQTITTPPTPPQTSDPINFRVRGDAFLSWIVVFFSQLVVLISQINSTATTVNDDATTASNAKDAAVASANFQGTWSSATAYTIGQSVAYNNNVYRAILASTNQIPSSATTYWVLLTGVKKVNNLSPDASGNINTEARIGTIASAATTTIGTEGLSETQHVTGVVTITSLGVAVAGVMRTLIFDGILTLTHNATSLILPDATNIITAVGDSAEFVCDTTNNWKLLRYTRAITPTPFPIASTAEVQAGTNNTKGITPLALMGALANVKSANGYTKLPNGLILQWGSATASDSNTNTLTIVTFPITFPISCAIALCTYAGVTGGVSSYSVTAKSTTNFTASRENYGNIDPGVVFNWFAIGY